VQQPDNDLKGLVPMPGWERRYDWTGWVPFEDLPRLIDPPDGRIVTANQKIVYGNASAFLTSEWYLPYRAERIEQLLDATPKHTAESMRAIQADVTSLAARDFVAALRSLDPKPKSAAAIRARELVFAWDGAMRLDAAEPALFHAWLRTLRERIFADDLGPLAEDFVFDAENTHALLLVLQGRANTRDWCDDATTPDKRETCSELAAETLDAAVADLGRGSGRDALSLRWNDVRRAVLEHRPMSKVPVLRRLFELSIPYPGDTYTVNAGRLWLRNPGAFDTHFAASFRAVYDLSAPADGSWIYATGQVGHPSSRHYDDLLASWRNVQAFPVRWEAPNETGSAKTLVLTPIQPSH